ncbi:hypothetical protein ACO0R3_002188 [Hanseniaspora guilliermondii]
MNQSYEFKTPATPPAEDGMDTPQSIAELDDDDILDLNITSYNKLPPVTPLVENENIERGNEDEIADDSDIEEISYEPAIAFTPTAIYPHRERLIHDEEVEVVSRRLSDVQQMKFLNYCEETSAEIQKEYIKWKNKEAETNNIKDNEHLIITLTKFKRLIDFVWHTIDWNCKDTANLLQYLDTDEFDLDQYVYIFKEVQDMGQISIFLKLADDLLSTIIKYKIMQLEENTSVFQWIFKVFYILDDIFMLFAYDLKVNNPNSLMKMTEAIRLKPILERTRVEITNWFKDCNVNKYQYELSKIYEKSLYNLHL